MFHRKDAEDAERNIFWPSAEKAEGQKYLYVLCDSAVDLKDSGSSLDK